MPKKKFSISNLMKTSRFKEETNNRSYTQDDIKQIELLYEHIISRDLNLTNGYYKTFCQLISYDLSNLINRFDFLVENKTKTTKETYIARYGYTVGMDRWNHYQETQRIKNLFETKKEKYGWTLEDFKKYNQSRAVTKALCISRHGEEQGLEMWNNYVNRQRYTNSIEYFEEKYGQNGQHKWLEYNEEKSKSHNLEWIMSKYSVTMDGALEILSRRENRKYTSKAELKFVNLIEATLNIKLEHTAKTKQFCIWSDVLKRPCFYDIADSRKMKMIEFYGDYWHCNPLLYNSEFYHPHKKMTANEIWNYDKLKINVAINKGFALKIIWEHDFTKNNHAVIQECAEWWTT